MTQASRPRCQASQGCPRGPGSVPWPCSHQLKRHKLPSGLSMEGVAALASAIPSSMLVIQLGSSPGQPCSVGSVSHQLKMQISLVSGCACLTWGIVHFACLAPGGLTLQGWLLAHGPRSLDLLLPRLLALLWVQ